MSKPFTLTPPPEETEPEKRKTMPYVRPEVPDWAGALTHAQAMRALRGFHPTGRPLHDDPALRCKGCKHVARRHYSGTYIKCELDRKTWTGGPGTDIKLKWRACEKWEP